MHTLEGNIVFDPPPQTAKLYLKPIKNVLPQQEMISFYTCADCTNTQEEAFKYHWFAYMKLLISNSAGTTFAKLHCASGS